MTDYINVFPDGLMESNSVNDPCWNDAAWPPNLCNLTKNLAAPHSGLRNLRFTSAAVTTTCYAYGLFPSQTPGAIGGNFNVDFSCWVKTVDPGTSINLKINLKDAGSMDVTVTSDNWALVGPYNLDVLREGPNGEGILRVKGIGAPLQVGDFVELDDVRALEILDLEATTDKPEGFSCWCCDKFQPTDPELYQTGECRALSPLQFELAAAALKADPLFASIQHAPYTWCAAWKRRQKNQELPSPPPIVP